MAHFKKIIMAAGILVIICPIILLMVSALETPDLPDSKSLAKSQFVPGSSRFTGVYPDSKSYLVHSISKAFTNMAENDYLILYLNKDTLAIRILNKVTGYIWSSDIDDFGEDRINQRWMNYINSGLTIEYTAFRNNSLESQSTVESFLTSAASKADIKEIDQGFSVCITFGESGIILSYSVYIDEQSVEIKMDQNSIIENEDFKLVSVEFFPFLGAARHETQDGYFLIPDGGGALVNFRNIYANVSTAYTKRYYGDDDAFISDRDGWYSSFLNFPIYGIVHGVRDNGLLVEIKDGYLDAELLVYPAGVRTKYYFISNKYLFRHHFHHIVAGDRQVTMYTPNMSEFDIKERIVLLSGDEADYSGMARVYRDNFTRNEKRCNPEGVPISLYALASGTGRGLFVNNDIIMTTIDQAKDIVRDMNNNGVNNIQLVYVDPFVSQRTGSERSRYTLRKGLGNKDDLRSLAKSLTAGGNNLAITVNYWSVFSRAADLDLREDIVRQHNRTYLIYDHKSGAVRYNWYNLNAHGFAKVFTQDVETFADMGIDTLNIWLRNTTSSFNTTRLTTRNDASEIIANTLNMASDKGVNLLLDSYSILTREALEAGQSLTWVSPETSLYPYITDTVPFISLVLRGQMDLFSHWLNNTGAPEETLLRLIEWGIYPQFIVTHRESAALMYATGWSNVVSSRYEDWRERIIDTYREINAALFSVHGEAMINHKTIIPGVSMAEYENGVKIFVNYTGEVYNDGSIKVEPMSFLVVGMP